MPGDRDCVFDQPAGSCRAGEEKPMHIAIANVLSPEETSAVRDALERARFIEGQATAGFAARTVKNNRQAAGGDRSLETIRKLVERNLGVAFLPRMCVEQEILRKTSAVRQISNTFSSDMPKHLPLAMSRYAQRSLRPKYSMVCAR